MWNRGKLLLTVLLLGATITAGRQVSAQGYRIERVASGLQQPVYMDQAPGDPSNIIYYMTRVTSGGVNAGSGTHGSLWRYDMNTRESTEVLNLSHRNLTLDLGPQGFAFHPDFNNPGTDGYQKLYVSSAAIGGPVNYVEEYAASGPNGTVPINGGNGLPEVSRTLLEYNNVFGDNNHVVDWIGFDPRAYSAPIGSPERNYLFISAGDGSNGRSADQRPEQKSNIVQGKLLRIDVDPDKPDFYPADPQKNFAIPETNPIPLWNSNHAANEQLVGTTLNYTSPTQSVSYSPAFPEVYFTGTRNTFRMSLDRETGDFWSGDVGEFAREEINFLPADPYDGSQVPYDFGFPQREGTGVYVSRSNGDTSIQWDLSGGGSVSADSVNPIQEGPHALLNSGSSSGTDEIRSTGRSAYIGGYVYRGPVEELQGKYFYSDFVQGNIFSLDFDTTTPVEDFSGDNLNQTEIQPGVMAASLGTKEVVLNRNLNSHWHTIMVDPQDPSYTPALGSSFGIGRVVSFGEDNAGNLYIVDLGGQRGNPGFNNDYPGGTTGQIFRVTPYVELTLLVDRDTGEVTLTNPSGAAVDLTGYTITSPSGAIETSQLTTIAGNYDVPSPPGDGSVDDNDSWQVTVDTDSEFSESTTGDAGTLIADAMKPLGGMGSWVQSIYEDWQLSIQLPSGATVVADVEFTGNGDQPFARSDLDFDGTLDADDWIQFRQNFFAEFDGMSLAHSYGLGDLDGDLDNDYDDFLLFKADYIATNGQAAFAALSAVPEPGSMALLSLAIGAVLAVRKRCRRPSRECSAGHSGLGGASRLSCVVAFAVVGSVFAGGMAHAVLTHQYTFNTGLEDSIGGVDGQAFGAVTTNTQGQLVLPGGSGDYLGFNAPELGLASYTDLTLETWFTIDNQQTWARLFDIGERGGTNEGYVYYAPESGNFGNPALARYATPNTRTNIEHTSPSAGQQHHLAFIIDDNANGGSDQFLVYLDGVLAGSTGHSRSLSGIIETYAYLGKSTFPGDVDPYFDGTIDEFRVYNHALSQTEVMNNYAAGPTPVATVSIYVNSITGDVTIATDSETPLNIDHYALRSAGGALNVAGWSSLDDQGVGGSGGPGQGWEEVELSDANRLGELYLLGNSPIASGSPLHLGNAYNPVVSGIGNDGDVTFEVGIAGIGLLTGQVVYLPGIGVIASEVVYSDVLLGDFNGDSIVNIADYSVWRNNLGATSGTGLSADHTGPNGQPDGVVDALDYQVWRSHFGATLPQSLETTAIPEPATCLLAIGFFAGYRYTRSARYRS